jgi:hypothetical protein
MSGGSVIKAGGGLSAEAFPQLKAALKMLYREYLTGWNVTDKKKRSIYTSGDVDLWGIYPNGHL